MPEELQALDALTKKLALPAPDAPQEQEPIAIAKAGSDEGSRHQRGQLRRDCFTVSQGYS
jgi:hypothetical protein